MGLLGFGSVSRRWARIHPIDLWGFGLRKPSPSCGFSMWQCIVSRPDDVVMAKKLLLTMVLLVSSDSNLEVQGMYKLSMTVLIIKPEKATKWL